MSPALRPRTALISAFACLVGLALTGALAYLVPVAHLHDSATLEGFVALNRPQLTVLLGDVAQAANPVPYGLIGLALAAVAALRHRGRVALAIVGLLFATGATAELLKQLLAHPRFSEWLGAGQISAASWPSGHATAAMTLALCGVLAVPARARPAAAATGTAFAIAVSFAILALGWHFPSDVIGGFFVAAMWTLLAVAGLLRWPGPERATTGARVALRGRDALGRVTLGAAGVATAAVVGIARPEAVSALVRDHPSFVIGAVSIAGLATLLAVGLARAVRT